MMARKPRTDSLPNPDEALAETFRVLGHENRLRLLELLAGGEYSVGDIEQRSGIGQPGLSQQLAVLRKAGLVNTRREAKLVFYSLNREGFVAATQWCAGLGLKDAPAPEPAAPAKRGSAARFARIL